MMREKTYDYPFTAIVGQEPMKEAILINLVNPSAGGVLIRGQKGTAKTTAVRAIPGLMKDCRVDPCQCHRRPCGRNHRHRSRTERRGKTVPARSSERGRRKYPLCG